METNPPQFLTTLQVWSYQQVILQSIPILSSFTCCTFSLAFTLSHLLVTPHSQRLSSCQMPSLPLFQHLPFANSDSWCATTDCKSQQLLQVPRCCLAPVSLLTCLNTANWEVQLCDLIAKASDQWPAWSQPEKITVLHLAFSDALVTQHWSVLFPQATADSRQCALILASTLPISLLQVFSHWLVTHFVFRCVTH